MPKLVTGKSVFVTTVVLGVLEDTFTNMPSNAVALYAIMGFIASIAVHFIFDEW